MKRYIYSSDVVPTDEATKIYQPTVQKKLDKIRERLLNEYKSYFKGLELRLSAYITPFMDPDDTIEGRFKAKVHVYSKNPSIDESYTLDLTDPITREFLGVQSVYQEISKHLKKYSKYSSKFTIASLKKILTENNIDSTKHNYELELEDSVDMEPYTLTFTCLGDYLAYFSLMLRAEPTPKNLKNYIDIDEFIDIVEENPNINSIKYYAGHHWDDDSADSIISLSNIDTGRILYP